MFFLLLRSCFPNPDYFDVPFITKKRHIIKLVGENEAAHSQVVLRTFIIHSKELFKII